MKAYSLVGRDSIEPRWWGAWAIVVFIWLLGCILITGYDSSTEAKLCAAWTAVSYQTLSRDGAVIDAAEAEFRILTSASASLMCIDDVLHMKYAYQDRLDGLNSYGEKQAQKERLPDQCLAVATGMVLWAVPSFGLYLLGAGIGRLIRRVEKPLCRPSRTAAMVFLWPDRTHRPMR
jgi:hypothetical protein